MAMQGNGASLEASGGAQGRQAHPNPNNIQRLRATIYQVRAQLH